MWNLLFTDPIFFGHYDAESILFVGFYALLCLLFVASYFLRTIPPFKQIWWFVKWFLIVLLVNLGINFLKKEVKEWWKK
jgi:hypothetical protein